MRLAPFVLLAVVVACGSPAPSAGSLSVPLAGNTADVQEISLEISALM